MKEARFKFQHSIYYMRFVGRTLLLDVDNIRVSNMKSWLIPIQKRYGIKSATTHTHSRARAIFDYLAKNPNNGRGLKSLPV